MYLGSAFLMKKPIINITSTVAINPKIFNPSAPRRKEESFVSVSSFIRSIKKLSHKLVVVYKLNHFIENPLRRKLESSF